MLFSKVCVLALCLFSLPTWALAPVKEFVKKQSYGSATNYRFEKADVDLTIQDTELSYTDLNQTNAKEIGELIEVKKEYGKVFGFKEWTAENHKLLEDKSDRYFVVQGHYKDAENKTVNFIEVYWANAQKSGQFLLTSNSQKFKLEQFREYLKP